MEFEVRRPPKNAAVDNNGLWDRGCMVHHSRLRDVTSIPKCDGGRQVQGWSELVPSASAHRGQVIACGDPCARVLPQSPPRVVHESAPVIPDEKPSQVCCSSAFAPLNCRFEEPTTRPRMARLPPRRVEALLQRACARQKRRGAPHARHDREQLGTRLDPERRKLCAR